MSFLTAAALAGFGASMAQNFGYDVSKGAFSVVKNLAADEKRTLKKTFCQYIEAEKRFIDNINAFEKAKCYCGSDDALTDVMDVLFQSGRERENAFESIVQKLCSFGITKEEAEKLAFQLVTIVNNHYTEKNAAESRVLAANTAQAVMENGNENRDRIIQSGAQQAESIKEHFDQRLDRLETANHNAAFPKLLTAPPRNGSSDCIARETELSELSELLKVNRKLLLVNGVGGVGKTTVAGELYYRLVQQFDYIGWVNYSGELKRDLALSFPQPGYNLNSPETIAKRYGEIMSFLRNTPNILLFVDNVNTGTSKDSDLKELLSLPYLRAILTSRRPDLSSCTPYTINVLPLPAAIDLFYHYCPLLDVKREETEAIVKDMVERMGCHTLAVELLAKNYPGRGMERYYRQLSDNGLNSFRLEFSTQHNDNDATVAEHLHKLFPMSERSEEEQRVLRNFALMPTMTIPFEVQDWIEKKEEPIYIGNTLKKLVETGWLTQNADGYYMHAVVSTTIRLDAMPEDTGREFVAFLGKKCPEYITNRETYLTALPKIELADAVLNAVTFVDEACAVAWNVLFYLYLTWSIYQNADWFMEKKLPAFEAILGSESAVLATTYNNLASLYQAKGDLDSALKYNLKAKEIQEKGQGLEHPLTATTYNNLALLYQAKGDLDNALAYFEKALPIVKKRLGEEHPNTASTYVNLAGLYQDKGDLDNALRYFEMALAIDKKQLGENHPYTATTYNNLALLYKAKGDFGKALEYNFKAKEIREKVLGNNHPDTANTYHNLALLYKAKDDLDNALRYFEMALPIVKKQLGENHPDTATTYHSIGTLYYKMEDYPKAEEYLLKAFRIWRVVLGMEHSKTEANFEWLIDCYQAQHHTLDGFVEWLHSQI